MSYYKDLRDYISKLEERNLLWRIKSPINKETELIPLVRWQFRGLPEEERRAFLFENVTDVHGKNYGSPVLVGALAGSRAIYALGMGCKPEEITSKWVQAQMNPIPPKLVKTGPAQEEVYQGDNLKGEGLYKFPFPVNTPGFGGGLRSTASHWFSKDPETGARNIGNYAGFIHAPDRVVMGLSKTQHLAIHLAKAKALKKPLEAALVIGVLPAFAIVSAAKVAYGADEIAVACGLAGESLEVAKCLTLDIEIPASAEIVIEGLISTDYMEPHMGSFGEYSGYMAEGHPSPVFNVQCITHRRKPVLTSIISQMPPSESSKIRQISREGNFFKFLKHDCNIPGILDVAFHESGGATQSCVIQIQKMQNSQAWQALNAAVAFAAAIGKFIIAVDEDIDPHDLDSVNWALSFRVQPHRDIRITQGKSAALDPSTAPCGSPQDELVYPKPGGASAILIDATRKWDYPPVALPKRAYMEKAREIWEREGLPPLKPRAPWHGYELGYWPRRYEEAAQATVKGETHDLGEKCKQERSAFLLRE